PIRSIRWFRRTRERRSPHSRRSRQIRCVAHCPTASSVAARGMPSSWWIPRKSRRKLARWLTEVRWQAGELQALCSIGEACLSTLGRFDGDFFLEFAQAFLPDLQVVVTCRNAFNVELASRS